MALNTVHDPQKVYLLRYLIKEACPFYSLFLPQHNTMSPEKQEQTANNDQLELRVVENNGDNVEKQAEHNEEDEDDGGEYNNDHDDEDDDEGVRCIQHYTSVQQILIAGDGDFSFSLCLANAFQTAKNIVATSLDSYDDLLKKYAKAESNLKILSEMGATILHRVDATKMKSHTDLKMRKFDRIVFNFPHAGFKGREDLSRVIRLHRGLVRDFFHNASHMLRPHGEVHVTHKTGDPFQKWNLEELASKNSLVLVECSNFIITEYPGYSNKRGEGVDCDKPFPLKECLTYKFRVGKICKKKPSLQKHIQDSGNHVWGGSQIGNRYLDGTSTMCYSPLVIPQAGYQLSSPALHQNSTLLHDHHILDPQRHYIGRRPHFQYADAADSRLHFLQPREHQILAPRRELSAWVGTHLGHAQATVSNWHPPLLHKPEIFRTREAVRAHVDYSQSVSNNWEQPMLLAHHVLSPQREFARIIPQNQYAIQNSLGLRNDLHKSEAPELSVPRFLSYSNEPYQREFPRIIPQDQYAVQDSLRKSNDLYRYQAPESCVPRFLSNSPEPYQREFARIIPQDQYAVQGSLRIRNDLYRSEAPESSAPGSLCYPEEPYQYRPRLARPPLPFL